jgi:hypothetical protein
MVKSTIIGLFVWWLIVILCKQNKVVQSNKTKLCKQYNKNIVLNQIMKYKKTLCKQYNKISVKTNN